MKDYWDTPCHVKCYGKNADDQIDQPKRIERLLYSERLNERKTKINYNDRREKKRTWEEDKTKEGEMEEKRMMRILST